jgi:hypothetical protein
MELPSGTWIVFPSKDAADQFRAVAVNETKQGVTAQTVVAVSKLQIVSPSYIAERNSAELSLHKRISELETQLKSK